MILRKIIYSIILIGLGLTWFACSEPDSGLNNEDLIFTNSFPIDISPYSYTGEDGIVYTIQGDTSFLLSPDTVDSRPVLSWDSISAEYISAGIFTAPIQVYAGEIINIDNLVWQWHSGMDIDAVKPNFIQFSQGKSVIEGEIRYEEPPMELSPGNYYWAVWAWGTAGVNILFSSRQREVYVVN